MAAIKAIKVTPKMLEAGVRSYLSWNHHEDDPAQIVAEIFEEMNRARVQALAQTHAPQGCSEL